MKLPKVIELLIHRARMQTPDPWPKGQTVATALYYLAEEENSSTLGRATWVQTGLGLLGQPWHPPPDSFGANKHSGCYPGSDLA